MSRNQEFEEKTKLDAKFQAKTAQQIFESISVTAVRIEPGTRYHGVEYTLSYDPKIDTGFAVVASDREDGKCYGTDLEKGIGWACVAVRFK